jgi:hypothetical protein
VGSAAERGSIVSATGLVVRAQLRRRWGAVAFLAILVGLVGGTVVATVAGARRTQSSVARFNAEAHSAYLQLFAPEPTPGQVAALRRAPDVVAVGVARAYAVAFKDAPNLNAVAPVDGVLGTDVDRVRVIRGRVADPNNPNEIDLGESDAAQLHKHVGDVLGGDSYTPRQAEALARGVVDPGTPAGPPVQLRIVGIVRRPVDLGTQTAVGVPLVLTRAFDRAYANKIGLYGVGVLVRTRHGAADAGQVGAATAKIFGQAPQEAVTALSAQNDGAQGAVDVLAIALWIVAAAALGAGLVAIVIVVAREIGLQRGDQPALDSLGMTKRQRFVTLAAGGLIAGMIGAALVVVVAVAASPLFPIGLARRAEPSPGLHADWLALGGGVVAIAAFVVIVVVTLAMRAARDLHPAAGASRGRIADLATQGSLPPTVTSGLRLALQRGADQAAASLLPAVVGAVAGVLGVTAVLVFSANLGHLERTPRLYGWTWDVKATDAVSNERSCTNQDFGVLQQSGIDAAAAICYGTANITVDGRATNGWAFVPLRGNIGPEIIAGRAPAGASDVALGATTMHALGKHIGDHIRAAGPRGHGDYVITGEAVFPSLGQTQTLGDGAAFTGTAFAPLFDQNNFFRYIVARFAPGADPAAVERRLAAIPQLADVTTSSRPAEIERLRQIDWTPVSVAVLLGVLALIAVGHAILTAVRRRRRDFAVLKTLGFERTQVRATVAWQATTLAAIGLFIGIPAGVLVGRLVWRLVAGRLGVLTTTNLPLLAIALVVPAVVLLANAVAFFPAQAAARIRPAAVFRSR